MYYLIYSSVASEKLDEKSLEEILVTAELRNKQFNITGLLVFFDGTFIQMLEGDEEDVLNTFERIEDDPRHDQVIKLFSGQTDKRHFPDWKMALQVVDKATFSSIEAYEPLSEAERFLNEVNDDHIGLKMLAYFYEMKKG